MIARRRRFGLLGTLAAAFVILFAVLPLAAAPVLAGTQAALPHAKTMAGISADSDSPCANMAGKADHSPGKHAQNCLAQCMIAHGAVIPDLPDLDVAWLSPATLPNTPIACNLHAVAPGIEPPPPRQA